MVGATKFQFGTDFRGGARRAVGEAELAEARAEGFRAGEAQGRAQADQQMNGLLAALQRDAQSLLGAQDRAIAAIEAQAARLAVAVAKGVAGAALSARQLDALEAAARDCLGFARSAPHLVVRVTPDAVEAVEALMARLARESGFAGRIVVLGEPEIAPGDGRIEWADGGVTIDAARMGEMIERASAAVFGASAAGEL